MAIKDVLNGPGTRDQRRALSELVARRDGVAVREIGDALMESYWPACDALADALATMGTPAARDALLAALRARRHHVRSAAINALAILGGPDVRQAVQALSNDPSYEVRLDVAEALKRLDA